MSSKHCLSFAAVPFCVVLVACSGASPEGSGTQDEGRLEDPTTAAPTTDEANPTEASDDLPPEAPAVPHVVLAPLNTGAEEQGFQSGGGPGTTVVPEPLHPGALLEAHP